MNTKISPSELKHLLNTSAGVTILDVRLAEDRMPIDHPIPGAEWRNPEEVERWSKEIGAEDTVVVYHVYGHRVSQGVCATLRGNGIRVSYLGGGIEGWRELVRGDAPKAGK